MCSNSAAFERSPHALRRGRWGETEFLEDEAMTSQIPTIPCQDGQGGSRAPKRTNQRPRSSQHPGADVGPGFLPAKNALSVSGSRRASFSRIATSIASTYFIEFSGQSNACHPKRISGQSPAAAAPATAPRSSSSVASRPHVRVSRGRWRYRAGVHAPRSAGSTSLQFTLSIGSFSQSQLPCGRRHTSRRHHSRQGDYIQHA